MSPIEKSQPQGVLRTGWSAAVDDYAIAGGWSPDGKVLVVADTSGGVHGLEGTSGKTLWSVPRAHEGGVLTASVHPRELRIATGGQDGRVLIWSMGDGRVEQELTVSSTWAEHVAWSPRGQWIAASSGRVARVFTGGGEETWSSSDHPSTVSTLSWSGDAELATACYGAVCFFGILSGSENQKLEWKGSLVSMALSRDGDIVACGSQDNTVHFWRRSTGDDSMMSGYPTKPSALCFDSGGVLLATGGGVEVTVWSFDGKGPEGTRPGVLKLHVSLVTSLSFAHQGFRLASGGKDSGVVIWRLRRDGQGDPIGTAVVKSGVEKIYWRPDDRALAALDAHGGVTAWKVR